MTTNLEALVWFMTPTRPLTPPRPPTEKQQRDIIAGIRGTCKYCGRIVGIRISKGGDGAIRLCVIHKNKYAWSRCEGSQRPCKEWD